MTPESHAADKGIKIWPSLSDVATAWLMALLIGVVLLPWHLG
ncbi:MAG TPA: hypothetical protein VLX09_08245 [Stellaceae bacterium]|nr:hypothetical protein [Stellaceae bacterium]